VDDKSNGGHTGSSALFLLLISVLLILEYFSCSKTDPVGVDSDRGAVSSDFVVMRSDSGVEIGKLEDKDCWKVRNKNGFPVRLREFAQLPSGGIEFCGSTNLKAGGEIFLSSDVRLHEFSINRDVNGKEVTIGYLAPPVSGDR